MKLSWKRLEFNYLMHRWLGWGRTRAAFWAIVFWWKDRMR